MMDAGDLLDRLRLELNDENEPFLWSDDELFEYINDAQQQFCRQTNGIGDFSTVAVTQLTVPISGVSVALDQRILGIKSAWRTSDGTKVEVLNYEDMNRRCWRFDGTTGILKAVIIGMEPAKAYFYPIPSFADTVQMLVDRLPLLDISMAQLTFEIAPQHHINLALWAKHRAYGKQDTETMDKQKSMEAAQAFGLYCDVARRERERAAHKPRTVAFSW